jgi:hypothetical protein
VRAEFAVPGLVGTVRRGRRLRIRFAWTTLVPYTGLARTGAGRIICRRGFYVVHTDCDDSLRLGVVITPITPRRIAGRLVRTLRLRPQRRA